MNTCSMLMVIMIDSVCKGGTLQAAASGEADPEPGHSDRRSQDRRQELDSEIVCYLF